METFATGLSIALAVIVLAALLAPLARGAAQPGDDATVDAYSDLGRLREARHAALQAIMDIDDELDRGNITAGQHRALRATHVQRAAAVIREIEGREQVLDDEIERAVQRRREQTREATTPPTDEPAA